MSNQVTPQQLQAQSDRLDEIKFDYKLPRLTEEVTAGPWTQFHDMHSGGGSKEPWSKVYIQADEKTATEVFKKLFEQDPDNVSCDCCGPDYSVTEYKNLTVATAFERGCRYEGDSWVEQPDTRYSIKYVPLEGFLSEPNALFITKTEVARLAMEVP